MKSYLIMCIHLTDVWATGICSKEVAEWQNFTLHTLLLVSLSARQILQGRFTHEVVAAC